MDGPIAVGIIAYKSLMNLGMPKNAKTVIIISLFLAVFIILGWIGEIHILLLWLFSISFGFWVARIQRNLMIESGISLNNPYENLTSFFKNSIFGLILFITPILGYLGYLYLNPPCKNGYILAGDYCISSTGLKDIYNTIQESPFPKGQ